MSNNGVPFKSGLRVIQSLQRVTDGRTDGQTDGCAVAERDKIVSYTCTCALYYFLARAGLECG